MNISNKTGDVIDDSDGPMSSDEEDELNLLLTGAYEEEDINDPDFNSADFRQMRMVLTSPLDFIKLFLTQTIVLDICIATNHYGQSMIAKGGYSSYSNSQGLWNPVDEDEMWRFLCIVIFMSFYELHSIDRYWRTDSVYGGVPVRHLMTKLRFKSILCFLQVVPPADVDKNDKLGKINPFLDHVKTTSQKFYQPFENISIDERMLPSKHKFSGIRQFIKDKPIRFGLKLWVLACSVTGYTWDFYVYLGKKRTSGEDCRNGVAYSVVFRLMHKLFFQGYHLFVDSFYTSLKLVNDLFQKCVYLVGTVRGQSSAMPDEFKDLKQWEKKASRGDHRWIRNSDTKHFVTVQWKDTKTVTLISTLHSGSELTSCGRTLQKRTGWKRKDVKQPISISDYNQYMGGEDKSNQMLLKYTCNIKQQIHWWKVLFFHALDICIVNSFIILQEYCKVFPNDVIVGFKPDIGQLEYRELIFEALFVHYTSIGEKSEQHKHMPGYLVNRLKCVYCHAKSMFEGGADPKVKTTTGCKGCDVPLCYTRDRNCFDLWHSGSDPAVRRYMTARGKNVKRDLKFV